MADTVKRYKKSVLQKDGIGKGLAEVFRVVDI